MNISSDINYLRPETIENKGLQKYVEFGMPLHIGIYL